MSDTDSQEIERAAKASAEADARKKRTDAVLSARRERIEESRINRDARAKISAANEPAEQIRLAAIAKRKAEEEEESIIRLYSSRLDELKKTFSRKRNFTPLYATLPEFLNTEMS